MTIDFKCPCGAACSADESQSGKMFPCPKCGLQIKVPMPKTVDADRQQRVGDMINQVADVTGVGPRTKSDREDALKDLLGEDTLSQIRAESRQLRRALGDTVGVNVPEEGSGAGAPGGAAAGEAEAGAGGADGGGAAAAGGSAGGVPTSPGASAPGSDGAAPAGAAATGAPAAGGRSPLTRRLTVQTGESSEKEKKSWGPPPKGVERAAHHLAFKRVMWGPVILLGLTCVGFAVWCIIPHLKSQPAVATKEDDPEFRDVPVIVGDAKDEMWIIPRWITPAEGAEGTAAAPRRATPILRDDGTVAYKDAVGEIVPGKKIWLDLGARYWAVPAGHEPFITKNGSMLYNYTAAELAGSGQKDPQLKSIPAVVRNADDEMWAIPRGTEAVMRDDGTVAYKNDKGEEVPGKKLYKDPLGQYWAVPAGRTPNITKSGSMVYVGETGFEQLAESADNWLRGLAESAEGSVSLYNSTMKINDYLALQSSIDQSTLHTYRLFACFFGGVAVILLALGTWLWHDVRIVRRATEAAAAEELAAEEAALAAAGGQPGESAPPDDTH